MTAARFIALDVLGKSHSRQGFASELVEEALSKTDLSPRDRRFLTQLVFGVIRREGTLDAMLRPFIHREFHQVEPAILDALRLGVYQIAFLTQVPKHAAVNETVESAVHIGNPKAKGFLNGVMRRVAEMTTDRFVDMPRPDAVPFGMMSSSFEDERDPNAETKPKYRLLTRTVLADPRQEPVIYLSEGFSWPRWMAERWLDRFGWDECLRLGFWFNEPPPLWLRVNKLKGEREDYRLLLVSKNFDVLTGEHPQSLQLLDGGAIRSLPGYNEGEFTIQDHSSLLVATALNPLPGMRVLDLCAAPGGKTTHLAELMRNQGKIVACDIEEERLLTVETLCNRLGVNIVETHLLVDGTDAPPGPYDAALVDVPCSNTGVIGRRPEVRRRLKPNEFEHLIRLQTKLLFTALERVKPGGRVVYSTCSIEPDENEGVVNAVRRGMRNLILEAENHSIPGRPSDGGYWARLRKPE